MARLALKLFYLRSRVKRISQREAAENLDVRQAMISQLERDRVKPSLALLRRICEFYDVSADYLLDEDRGLAVEAPDRWRDRNARVVAGMWIEVPRTSIIEIKASDQLLVPLLPGQAFYDEDAKEVRIRDARATATLRKLSKQRQREAAQLEEQLETELAAINERRGRRSKSPGGSAKG